MICLCNMCQFLTKSPLALTCPASSGALLLNRVPGQYDRSNLRDNHFSCSDFSYVGLEYTCCRHSVQRDKQIPSVDMGQRLVILPIALLKQRS